MHIKNGLDIPLTGHPQQTIVVTKSTNTVGVVAADFHGVKPAMAVGVGDKVKQGQVLYRDKRNSKITINAPASGVVSAVNRGLRRVLQAVVIDVDKSVAPLEFAKMNATALAKAAQPPVRQVLLDSGQWAALRTRPFSQTPDPATQPQAIFVTAMDSQPLAANPQVILEYGENTAMFALGLQVMQAISTAPIFVVHAAENTDFPITPLNRVQYHSFSGKHPAGNVGTHMHFLAPVNRNGENWHIDYQDVIAWGYLFNYGHTSRQRCVAISGPVALNPCIVETVRGADLYTLCADEMKDTDNARIISGSVLAGRTATREAGYLGQFHNQVTCLGHNDARELFHYLRAGINKFSVTNAYISKLIKNKKFAMTTSTNGSERAMMPIGNYEKVMPLDIMPTQLLRALIVGDIDTAEQLGCLELDEEDLALCTFVCPGKYEYGPILRDALHTIQVEG